MARTKQDRQGEWKRERVQRVLDYHNKKYRTRIEIKGKTQNVRPDLKGKSDWDWVCYNTRTGYEIALEVKKLTDTKSEERVKIVWQLLEEVSHSLSGKVPGTFSLFINVPKDYYLPLNKQNRQELRDLLCEVIYETAQRLKSEEEDLKPEILRRLSYKLKNDCSFKLTKLSDKGSAICKSSGITGWGSISFDESELAEFEQLVSQANIQLEKAKVRENFLVLIEEGHRPKDPPEVAEALKNINSASYSGINHVYFIRGEEIAEIPFAYSLFRFIIPID